MIVIPAIDLRDGKCVRLFQGDYSQTTVFAPNPVEVARRWQAEGARWLHVVDLDGAAIGQPANLEVVREIVKAVDIPVQLGGGIRSLETINSVLGMGVRRVILGTAAVEDADMVTAACQQFGGAIMVAVDARDGLVATRGWIQKTDIMATDLVRRMRELGVARVLYTDIARDGTLTEPNFEAIRELVSSVDVNVIAAGGVSSVAHILRLREIGAEAAIAGKALYTGDLSLPEALMAVRDAD
ncbi:MAG: 1-(5-phosphoribosyl)-5-[(5-phosphoribosylamino)methylideneamino]imidazole-4-carboxamide isomerase [Dehalococcoidia bacterium]|nr:1-(5-phosphoribosyl)-5-[(5-phosphoribosylamino)methylideneamino]imidazole-4-carboxamide isomerase [Dehalococcoidia bacterium]